MNFSKFSKTIFAIISSCCLYAGGVDALEKKILDARQNLPNKPSKVMVKIGNGTHGTIYKHLDPNETTKVIKVINNFENTDNNTVNELDMAIILTKDTCHPSLMKVYDVNLHRTTENKQTAWYTCEKIEGNPIKTDKTVVSWKTFCEQWALGLFRGMEYLRQQLGHTIRKDSKKKEHKCFILLGDRNQDNILVRKSNKVPVHVDLGLLEYIDIETGQRYAFDEKSQTTRECNSRCISEICNWLLRKINNRQVEILEKDKKKAEELKKIFEQNLHCDKPQEETIKNIIDKIQKIIE